jgi:quercetin dioxygenase-like cupin family protein
MEIKRSGSQASTKGPSDWFTGTVRIDPLFQAPDPARVAGASVTFEPGARTAWHTHPLGQTLIVTAGFGWTQRERGPIEEIRPGDIVWFSPGEKHWHGATPTTAMTHIAIQERLDGRRSIGWRKLPTSNTRNDRHSCPVLAQSGHPSCAHQCPLLAQSGHPGRAWMKSRSLTRHKNPARWPHSSKRLAVNVLPCCTRRLTDPSVR